MKTMPCRLCGTLAPFVFSKTILKNYDAAYFLCPKCDLFQTSEPVWIKDAYTDAIAITDVGTMVRNKALVDTTLGLYRFLGKENIQNCLDYGGGVGIFTRCMRDLGVNFFWHDVYCNNILAKGFAGDPSKQYNLITAAEVWEHLVNVNTELNALFSQSPQFLFVHTLLRWTVDPNWWYLAPETGQHVSFYSQQTMQFIARKYGYKCFSGHSFSLFISNDIRLPGWKTFLLKKFMYRPHLLAAYGRFFQWVRPLTSLCERDAQAVCAQP